MGGRARIVITASEDVGDTLEVDRMLSLLISVFSFEHWTLRLNDLRKHYRFDHCPVRAYTGGNQ